MAGLPQMPPSSGGSPSAAPPVQPPSPASGSPLGALGGSPNAGGSLLQMILAFLAGSGLDKTVSSLTKLMNGRGQGRGANGGDQSRPHQGGVKVQAGPPGATVTPSAMAQQQQGGQPSPQMIQQLLAMLAAKQGGPPGMPPGMPPQGPQ